MKPLSFFLGCLFGLPVFSQESSAKNSQELAVYTLHGAAYMGVKYNAIVEGSPYFREEWMKVSIKGKDGVTYGSPRARFNIVDNNMIFLDAGDKEMVTSLSFTEIRLTDSGTGKTYHLVDASHFPSTALVKAGWYEVLCTGEVSLYKHISKSISESRPMYSASSEQRINTSEAFLIIRKGTSTPLKPKDLATVLGDKKKEMEEFLKRPEVRVLPVDTRLKLAVEYYNSL
jgi:hypothetical protein